MLPAIHIAEHIMANIVLYSVNQGAHIFFRSAIMIVLFGGLCIFRPLPLPEGPINSITGINVWVKVTFMGF